MGLFSKFRSKFSKAEPEKPVEELKFQEEIKSDTAEKQVEEIFEEKIETAVEKVEEAVEKLEEFPLGSKPKAVKCVETGVVYRSITQAAKAYGVGRNTMRSKIADPNHHSKRLQGLTFVVIDEEE